MSSRKKVFIIAEAGVNHNGDIKTAKKMVDVAAKAGADAIKFQTFRSENVVSKYAPKAEYQRKQTDLSESQLDMIKKLELSKKAHKELQKYCGKMKIMFLSTPFDLDSMELLEELGLNILKISSGEITNLPFLKAIGGSGKQIIMSTGMANMREIKTALETLINTGVRKRNIILLHCNTDYPTPMEDVNLRAMLAIKDKFGVEIGYSDHTLGIEIPAAAVALGATVIEKHFTLDRKMEGPDHKASLEPAELAAMVKAVRNIEKALGDGIKRASRSEKKTIDIARKSIVASCDIPKGLVILKSALTIKRPGTGIKPKYLNKLIGMRTRGNIKKDKVIMWKDLK